jgi:flagellar biosynthesis protein FliP
VKTSVLWLTVVILLLAAAPVLAAPPAQGKPALPASQAQAKSALPAPQTQGNLDLTLDGIGRVSAPMQIVLLLTLLTFVPAILVTMTSFTRIVIVFHFLRQALGTQEMPSNQILIGLSLFLTVFVMAPVGERINEVAIGPALAGTITTGDAIGLATPPLRTFMLRQTREADLALFVEMAKLPKPKSRDELPMRVVVPAFIISELKTGFQMGFFLFVPFLLIDLVISTTLLSMGMMQLPPAMVSLPFKVLLFVMIDGWNLLVGSVVRSFM